MKKSVKAAVLSVLAATILIPASVAAPKKDKVLVYSALDEKTTNDLVAAFEKKTGIKAEVALQIEQAGSIAARIKTEAAHPRADVIIGGNSNFHAELATNGFLQKYSSPLVKELKISSRFQDPDGYWTGWYLGALCLIYNNERFEKLMAPKGLKAPATWDDLLDPAYKGEIIASNPATTGGAYLMLCAQIFRLGSADKGFEYIKALNKNVAQYTSGTNGSIPLVSAGEATAGFAWGHDTLKQKLKGNLPITVVFPKDTGYEIGAASIIKKGPNAKGAKQFIDFLLSQEAGSINATNGYRYPVRSGVSLPEGVPAFESLSFAPWNLAEAATKTEAWKKQWSEATGK